MSDCRKCGMSLSGCMCHISAAEEKEAIPPVTAKPNPHKCVGCENKLAHIDTQREIMSGLYRTIDKMRDTVIKLRDALDARGEQ